MATDTSTTTTMDVSDLEVQPINAKKQKTDSESPENSKYLFRVIFEQVGSLKQLVDVVGSVLGRVFFQLKAKKDSPDGGIVLSIDTIDPQHVCIVQSRLVCNGEISNQGSAFCIDTQTLTKCLRNLPSHHSVELSMENGSANVFLRSFDQMASNSVEDIDFSFPTFDDECENMPLDDLDYKYETDIELPDLKRLIKLGDALKCDTVNMALSTFTEKDGTTHAITSFSGNGDAGFKRRFRSIVCNSSNSSKAADDTTTKIDVKNMVTIFEANFSLDYFNRFIKSMEHHNVNLKFGKDKDGVDLPLTIKYPLGVPDSFVRFVLAPKTDDAA